MSITLPPLPLLPAFRPPEHGDAAVAFGLYLHACDCTYKYATAYATAAVEAQKIDIMDTTHVMTTRMERAIARWFKAQPLRETQAETPVEPVEDLAMQARAAALEEAALLVESRSDLPAEAAVNAQVKAAVDAGDEDAELRARRHWLDVSTHNAVLRRAAAGIRALAATTVGAKP